MNRVCVIVFGKISPVHKGHGKLFKYAERLRNATIRESGITYSELKIVVTSSEYNNITPELKREMINFYYPEYERYLSTEQSIFELLSSINDKFETIIVVSGSDRTHKFKEILDRYNGVLYNYENIYSVCAGDRDDDEYSSTQVRAAVLARDYEKYCSLMPDIRSAFKSHRRFYRELSVRLGILK